MLKPALKPNTGHLPSKKGCCQQQGRALPTRPESAPVPASAAHHSAQTGRQQRQSAPSFSRLSEVCGSVGFLSEASLTMESQIMANHTKLGGRAAVDGCDGSVVSHSAFTEACDAHLSVAQEG